MKKLLSVMAVLLMAAVLAFPPAAHAVATLWLSDGTVPGTVTVTDNGAGDFNAAVGAITFIGAIGANWVANVTTGLTKPILGSASAPSMDLNSVNVSTAAGTITLMFNDTGFTSAGNAVASMNIGGTTGGTVAYSAYFDNNNASIPPLAGALIGSLGPFGVNPFSGADDFNFNPDSLYSLTQVVSITHPAGVGVSTSFDAELKVVPLPPTALLLGGGLLGLVALGWRRRRS